MPKKLLATIVILVTISALVGSSVAPILPVNANPNLILNPIRVRRLQQASKSFSKWILQKKTQHTQGTVNVVLNVTVDGPSKINGLGTQQESYVDDLPRRLDATKQ